MKTLYILPILLAAGLPAVQANAAALDNGRNMNGVELNGRNMNGRNMNGLATNGRNMNGLATNGLSTNGLSTNGLSADGANREEAAGDATIVILTDGELVGRR